MTALTPRPHLLARRGPKRWPPRIILPGCRCCVVPPTYYTPPRVTIPCCLNSIAQSLTLTILTAGGASSCSDLVGTTVPLSYRGLYFGEHYWDGLGSKMGAVLVCHDFGFGSWGFGSKIRCGEIPTPSVGFGSAMNSTTCNPLTLNDASVTLEMPGTKVCCGTTSGTIVCSYVITE